MIDPDDQNLRAALGLLSELHEAQAYGAVLDQARSMIEAGIRHPVVIALFAESALLQADPSAELAHALIQDIIIHDRAMAQTMCELVRGILLPQAAQRFASHDNPGVEAYLTLGRWLLPEIAAAFDLPIRDHEIGIGFQTSSFDQIINLIDPRTPQAVHSMPRRPLSQQMVA